MKAYPPNAFEVVFSENIQGLGLAITLVSENLRNDTKYITSRTSLGWTNDMITYGNLIYLALITERIPIILKFLSTHIDPNAPPFIFGEVFDVPRLSQAVGIHLLQWHEVKDPESQVVDDLGCWTVWETVQQHIEIPEPRRSPSLNLLKLGETTPNIPFR
ncbi:hypothetical protein EV424DRAFT_1649070 [Suillus variegatus]|nr:hypothetical protein EV424DRAFT_1649070 [Suillus variegatus]